MKATGQQGRAERLQGPLEVVGAAKNKNTAFSKYRLPCSTSQVPRRAGQDRGPELKSPG